MHMDDKLGFMQGAYQDFLLSFLLRSSSVLKLTVEQMIVTSMLAPRSNTDITSNFKCPVISQAPTDHRLTANLSQRSRV